MNYFGKNRSGKQRYRCRSCGKTRQRYIQRGDLYTAPERVALVQDLARAGFGQADTMAITGLAKNTVSKIVNRMIADGLRCPCDQPHGHKGWCRFRFQQSEARQSFMTEWGRA